MPSVWPPGGYGTTIRIGRAGHEDCASVFADGAHNTAAEPVTNVRRVSFFIFLPVSNLASVQRRLKLF